jgi:hypothetical protein
VADEQRAAAGVEVPLCERERLLDAKAAAPKDDDQGAQASAVRPVPTLRITATISSTVGGSAG